jgi:hypothetical protein
VFICKSIDVRAHTHTNRYDDIHTLANAISKHILFDAYEFHYVQACALEALRRLIMNCKDKDTSMKQKTFDLLTQIGNGTYSKSVFRSVRKGSHRLLKAVGYKHLDLYRCFRCAKYVVNHSVSQ